MRTILCPQCDEPCITVEYGGVEIDCCLTCQGVWLDGGELEALVGTPVPLKEPDPELGPPDRDCPICVDKLIKERYGRTDVVVDTCPYGDGVWLDQGELQAILAAYEDAAPEADAHAGSGAGALSSFFAKKPSGPTGESDADTPGKETS